MSRNAQVEFDSGSLRAYSEPSRSGKRSMHAVDAGSTVPYEELRSRDQKIEGTYALLKSYIDIKLGKRKGFTKAEAGSIVTNDLVPTVKDRNFSDLETKQLGKEMGNEPFFETKKSISVKVDIFGDVKTATFDLVIMPDATGKLKFDLIPAAGDELATELRTPGLS